jgi:hypothetical protein
MAKKSKEPVQKKGTNVFFGVLIAAIAIAAVYVTLQQPAASVTKDDTTAATTQAPKVEKEAVSADPVKVNAKEKKDAVRSSGDVPTYEEYIAKSIENKWTPSDPVEKLEATIAKYGQVHTLNLLMTQWCARLTFFSLVHLPLSCTKWWILRTRRCWAAS